VRFEVDFVNPNTGEQKIVTVTLSEDEVQKAALAHDPDLYRRTYAMRHAFRENPWLSEKGFVQIAHGQRAIMLN
jgi:hypothetical protein